MKMVQNFCFLLAEFFPKDLQIHMFKNSIFSQVGTMMIPLQVGMTFVVDHSGRIRKRPTIKDVIANEHVSCHIFW